jgi:hypothetical protein
MINIILYTICYTPAIQNATSLGNVLSATLNSSCIGGYGGLAISIVVFLVFTSIFSFKIKAPDAALAGSLITAVVSLGLIGLGVMNPNQLLIWIGAMILFALVSLVYHSQHPFD